MSTRLRNANGDYVTVDDDRVGYMSGLGYEPVSDDQVSADAATLAAKPKDRGVIGGINAFATSTLSGLTLGASDRLLGAVMTDDEREQLSQDRRAHPTISTAGEVLGNVAPAVFSGGSTVAGSILSKTPAALLSRAGARIAETGAGKGLLARTGALAVGSALEGAGQTGGAYLAQTALEDKPLSAEGFIGAMKGGGLFGGAVGGALGVSEKALMRARALFPKSEITRASAQAVEREATDAIRGALDDGAAMQAAATREIETRKLAVAKARLEHGAIPDPAILDPAGTSVGRRPRRVFDPASPDPALADTGLAPPTAAPPSAAAQAADRVVFDFAPPPGKIDRTVPWQEIEAGKAPASADEILGAKPADLDEQIRRVARAGDLDLAPALEPVVPRGVPSPPTAGASLEEQLRAMSAQADAGVPLRDMQGARGIPGPTAPVAPTAPAAAVPGEVFAKHKLTSRIEEAGNEVELHLDDAGGGQVGRLLMRREKGGEFRLSHVTLDGTGLKGKGVGTAMYREMAEYLERKHGAKLLSDFSRSPEADKLWERLVKEGEARPVWEKRDPIDGPPSYYVMEPRARPAASEAAHAGTSRIPDHDALNARLDSEGVDFIEETLPASEIERLGWYEPAGAHADPVRTANARKAIAEGQREPIKLAVTPNGKIVVMDGRHRLAAAVEAGAPIKVKWTTGFEPASHDVFHGGTGAAAAVDDAVAAAVGPRAITPEAVTDAAAAADPQAAKILDAARKEASTRAEVEAMFGAQTGPAERTAVGRRGASAPVVEAKATNGTGTVPWQEVEAAKARGEFPPTGGSTPPDLMAELRRAVGHDRPVGSAWVPLTTPEGRVIGTAPIIDDLADDILAHGTPAGKAAGSIDDQIATALGRRVGHMVPMGHDLADAARKIGAHEEALADLADALGDAAPRAAVERATKLRAAQAAAADSHAAATAQIAGQVESHVLPEAARRSGGAMGDATLVDTVAPGALQGALDRGAASEAKATARAAKAGEKAAKDAAAGAAKAADVIGLPQPGARPNNLGALADVGAGLEVLKQLGVAVPDVDKIPLIGPVLSLYLKARAALGIWKRAGGAVPQSMEGLIAAKGAATKDRAAAAVSKMLDLGTKAVKKAQPAAGPLGALAYRLFPGSENAPRAPAKGAQADHVDLYHQRLDELARAAQPGAIEQAVQQRVPTSDPALHQQIVNTVTRKLSFLDSKMPRPPDMPDMLRGNKPWQPSKEQLEQVGRYMEAADNPAGVLENVAAGRGVSPEAAETLRTVYPALYAYAQALLVKNAATMANTVPYARRVSLSILFKVPGDRSMTSSHLKFLQQGSPAAASPGQGAPAGAPPAGAPPTPSIAGPVSIDTRTMTSLDRRAGM